MYKKGINVMLIGVYMRMFCTYCYDFMATLNQKEAQECEIHHYSYEQKGTTHI